MSYTVPSSVHTGSSKGVNVIAQQLKGRRWKGAFLRSLYPPNSLCSLAVRYPLSFWARFFPMLLLCWALKRGVLAGKLCGCWWCCLAEHGA